MKRLGTVLTVGLLIMSASGCAAIEKARFNGRWADKLAPDFELAALDGAKVQLSDYRGKPVVLTFWGHG